MCTLFVHSSWQHRLVAGRGPLREQGRRPARLTGAGAPQAHRRATRAGGSDRRGDRRPLAYRPDRTAGPPFAVPAQLVTSLGTRQPARAGGTSPMARSRARNSTTSVMRVRGPASSKVLVAEGGEGATDYLVNESMGGSSSVIRDVIRHRSPKCRASRPTSWPSKIRPVVQREFRNLSATLADPLPTQ